MSEQVETRLTPRERLTRGLAYSAVGPVDVTRGLLELGVGLGLQSARSTAAGLRRRYRKADWPARSLPPKRRSLKS